MTLALAQVGSSAVALHGANLDEVRRKPAISNVLTALI